eukprot:SAG31_NODE_61_length_29286_cov_444.645973_18_plen_53_part_00
MNRYVLLDSILKFSTGVYVYGAVGRDMNRYIRCSKYVGGLVVVVVVVVTSMT